MRGHRDLRWASIAAAVCALVAALVPWEVVRIVAALPLTLFLPGYAIVAAAFGSSELALPKRMMLSVGVSLTVLVLGALVLNVFPFGIRTASWAVLLSLVAIAACWGAALRRGASQPERKRRPVAGLRPSRGSAALLAAAVIVAGAAIALAQKPLPAKNAEGFTALWMLPTDAREEAVAIGVESNEQDPASYRLEVEVGAKGKPREYRVELKPGEEKTFEVDVPSKPGRRTHVVASLYREGEPQRLFRRVTRWLPRQKTFP
ncbi:MAG: DUF1616 domain-containing protein [Solirubrobacterales bacterium]